MKKLVLLVATLLFSAFALAANAENSNVATSSTSFFMIASPR